MKLCGENPLISFSSNDVMQRSDALAGTALVLVMRKGGLLKSTRDVIRVIRKKLMLASVFILGSRPER